MVNPIRMRQPNPDVHNTYKPKAFGVTPKTQFPLPYQDSIGLYVDYRSPGAASGPKPPSYPPSVVGNEMQYYSHLAQSDPALTDYARRQAIQAHELGLSTGKKMFADNLQARKDVAMRNRMIQSGLMYPAGVQDRMIESQVEMPRSMRDDIQRRALK